MFLQVCQGLGLSFGDCLIAFVGFDLLFFA
jgi:hypothetical protein